MLDTSSYKVFDSWPELVHGQRKSGKNEFQSLQWMLMQKRKAGVSTVPLSAQCNNTTVIFKVLDSSYSLFFFQLYNPCTVFFNFLSCSHKNSMLFPYLNILIVFLLRLEILHIFHTDVTIFWVNCCNKSFI